MLVDYFQCIPTNVDGSKKKEARDLDKFEYEAGKLTAFKKRVNLAQILKTLEEICHSVFWQAVQWRKSGAFLTCKPDGCDSSCCQEQCGKGAISTSQLPLSVCLLKGPSFIKITKNCFKMVAFSHSRRWGELGMGFGSRMGQVDKSPLFS